MSKNNNCERSNINMIPSRYFFNKNSIFFSPIANAINKRSVSRSKERDFGTKNKFKNGEFRIDTS